MGVRYTQVRLYKISHAPLIEVYEAADCHLNVLTAIVLGPRSQSPESDSPWTDLWPGNADVFPVVVSLLSGNTSTIEGFAVINVFSVQNNLDRDLLKIVTLCSSKQSCF